MGLGHEGGEGHEGCERVRAGDEGHGLDRLAGGEVEFTLNSLLVFARTRPPLSEILLWMTPSEPPRALQASECSELLDPTRASCLIPAQRQPGKFTTYLGPDAFE